MAKSVQRTRTEVLKLLERGLVTGGDGLWDDFVSVPIANPELEAIRGECQDVNLAPKAEFENTLQRLIAKLRTKEAHD